MNTTTLLSVIGSLISALTFTSCMVDIPVGGGNRPQGPVYQQGGPPPGYGGGQGYPVYQQNHQGGFNPYNGYNGGGYGRPYGRPITPPNSYGDAASSRVAGFPPPGGYNPNFHYGGW